MRHVDEGGLHAWLDGELDALPASEAEWIREHLEACADCARRLDRERTVRDAADAALAGAAVDLTGLPTLEEMRAEARRGAGGGDGTGSGPRFRRLAWAASVVLAAGAGWMANGLVTAPEGPEIYPLMQSVTPAAEVVRDRAAPQEETAEDAAADRMQEADATGAAEARTAEPEAQARADAGAPAESPAPTVARELVRQAPAPETEAQLSAMTVDPAESRRVMAAEGLAAADESAKATDDAEAPGLGVPGLPVLATEFVAAGDAGSGIRILQALPGGDTLQVYRLPAGTRPAALPPAEPGVAQWEEARDGGWLVLRARLDAAELARLGGTVR